MLDRLGELAFGDVVSGLLHLLVGLVDLLLVAAGIDSSVDRLLGKGLVGFQRARHHRLGGRIVLDLLLGELGDRLALLVEDLLAVLGVEGRVVEVQELLLRDRRDRFRHVIETAGGDTNVVVEVQTGKPFVQVIRYAAESFTQAPPCTSASRAWKVGWFGPASGTIRPK